MAIFKAACVQLNSGNDMTANLRAAGGGVRAAAEQGAQLIMLPEYAALLDGSGRVMRENSYPEDQHPALPVFQALARETQAWLLVGSITVKIDNESMANRSYLLSSDGTIVARYDKIHMFDVTLPSGKVIRESSAYRSGARAVVAQTPWGTLGMTVCYDLRFPHLYRAHLVGDEDLAGEQGGAAGRLCGVSAARFQLRITDDVDERDHRLCVHSLSPAALYRRGAVSQFHRAGLRRLHGEAPWPGSARAARHLQDDGGGLQQPLGLGLLCPGPGAAVPAPEPRRQQHVPIAGLEERGLSAIPRQCGTGGRGGHLYRLHLHPGRDPLRLWKGSIEVNLDAKIPTGPLAAKWDKHKFDLKLVNPSNKRKFDIIVVGSGLAGASAAASLAELSYQVKCFCFQDSPRRAHSIAAQGGINAAKNYQNDGDSVYRLFYDTIKGGDFRAREANVYRLAQVSANIIDQCVAQGVPFAREYGGLLANRSFGGARMDPPTEMVDLWVIDGHAKGIVVRNLITGETSSHAADAVVLATGGYANAFFLSTNAKGCNVTATWRAYRKGAFYANPCYTQIHPT